MQFIYVTMERKETKLHTMDMAEQENLKDMRSVQDCEINIICNAINWKLIAVLTFNS